MLPSPRDTSALAEENLHFPENMAPKMINGDIIKKSAPNKMKIGIATIFSAIGVFGSFMLITGKSSTGGAGWITGIALCGLLVIFFGDVIDSFDFWNLKVQMRKVEESKKEIEELAYLTVRLVILSQNGVLTLGRTAEATDKIYAVSKKILEAAGIQKSDEVFQQILASDDRDTKND